MCTRPCVLSVNAFYKVNVACDCLCLTFAFSTRVHTPCVVFLYCFQFGDKVGFGIYDGCYFCCVSCNPLTWLCWVKFNATSTFWAQLYVCLLECFCLLICMLEKVWKCTLHLPPNLCVNFVQVGAQGNQLTMVKPNSYHINDSNLLDWFIL
jgi:hypothetical protein